MPSTNDQSEMTQANDSTSEKLKRLIAEGEASPIIENWSSEEFLARMKAKHDKGKQTL